MDKKTSRPIIEQAIKSITAARTNIILAKEESDGKHQKACYELALIQMAGARERLKGIIDNEEKRTNRDT